MNAIEWTLAKKDFYFVRWPLLGYLITGVVAILLMLSETSFGFTVGAIFLISVVVIIGAHLTYASVVFERGKQTLPFMMSLPITYMQYTRSKLVSCVGLFIIAWFILVAALLLVILGRESLQDGLVPLAVIILGELFAAYILTLSVAMVTESEAWTLVVMTVCNVCISLFILGVSQFQGIAATLESDVVVWTPTALAIVGAEILFICTVIVTALFLQSRKTDFL